MYSLRVLQLSFAGCYIWVKLYNFHGNNCSPSIVHAGDLQKQVDYRWVTISTKSSPSCHDPLSRAFPLAVDDVIDYNEDDCRAFPASWIETRTVRALRSLRDAYKSSCSHTRPATISQFVQPSALVFPLRPGSNLCCAPRVSKLLSNSECPLHSCGAVKSEWFFLWRVP